MSTSFPRARQAGVTMVELIMFIVIVSIALAGIIRVMSMTTGASADPLRRKQALMIAEGLLEEVRQADFTLCDPRSENAADAATAGACQFPENWGNEGAPPTTGYLRPFDNVNDYALQANVAATPFNDNAGFLLDAAGRRIDVAGYTASVTITPDRLNNIGALGAAADTDVLRIRITVNFAGDEPVILDGYRARYLPRPRVE